ncbi:hypothetical protein [Agromyces sp. NPDC058064]|uniref:hypothetical protein n=1 Tax=Agromyces sp. NPDC058064 TaxID=3346322 RepID=UPI0036DB9855
MSRNRSASASLIPGALFTVFVLSQGLALGARAVQLSNPLLVVVQGLGITAMILAIAYLSYTRHTRRLLAGLPRLSGDATDLLWVGARLHETEVEFGRLRAERVKLSLIYVVKVEHEVLSVHNLPDGEVVMAVPVSGIGELTVGTSTRLGVTNNCLFVDLDLNGLSARPPLVLQRNSTPFSVMQDSNRLEESARSLAALVH